MENVNDSKTAHLEGFNQGQADFSLLVNSIKDYGIFLMDPTGIIKSWNTGAEYVKGYKAEEVIGKHFSLFYMEEDKAIGHPAYELNVAAQTGRYEEEGWRVRKDGTKFWANAIITRLSDENGKIIGFSKVTRDLTERKIAESAIRESEEKFRLMIESVKDYAILMLDPEGHVVSWNEGAERIKGWKHSEIMGRHFSLFYPIEDVKNHKPEFELKIAIEEGRFEDTGIRVKKDGSTFWANVIITALKDDKGRIRGFSKVTRDITDRKKAEEEVKKAYNELEKRVQERTQALLVANKELESFSYSVSHDLRAPLRSMNGFSQALMSKYGEILDEKGKEYLTRIMESSQKMGHLIEDILKLSKLGRTELCKKRINLSELASEICEKLKREHPERTVEFSIQQNVKAVADEGLLRIAFENLIGNSFKYTTKIDSAKIEFGFHLKNNRPIYYVRDNGAGFDMAYADKLFTPFQRLHSDKEFPGTGIGLASVRRIVSLHSGEIWAMSEIQKGTTFFFTLDNQEN